MATIVSVEHIEMTPGIRGGKPRIAGTRIAVEDVMVMHLKMGYSLLEIATKIEMLILLYEIYTPEDMVGMVEYL